MEMEREWEGGRVLEGLLLEEQGVSLLPLCLLVHVALALVAVTLVVE